MTKIKISTLTKTAIAVATSLIIISGVSFGVYSFVLKPYTPIIAKISASDPNGTPRSASEFKAGDFIAIQGDNFLQSPYLWLDEIDLHFLNQNKQTITSKRWDNATVAPKISSGEITKNSIAKIAIPAEVPAALSAGGKLYLKLIFHFHKTWVGTKYDLTAQSSKSLALATLPPPVLGRQVLVPASWGLGDVYNDLSKPGAVNYDDLLSLGSILKKTIAPTADQKIQADLNLNQTLDFSDYIILNYLIDSDGSLTSSDLPIILGNINRSEQNPTKPNTQITVNNDDLNLLDDFLTTQPTVDYPTFLSADLNSDNDLTKTEDKDLLSQFLNQTIEYANLPKLVGPNYPPIASAGSDAAITVPDVPSQNITIALDGRGSIDREGDQLTYKWQILSAYYPDGASADILINPNNLTNGNKEQANYVLSIANQNKLVKDTYVIIDNHLTATDTKIQSATDAMQITITTPTTIPAGNNPPVASITAEPLTVVPGGKVNLDGLNSYDADGRITSFRWTMEPAGQGSFADERASVTTYTAPASEISVKIKLTVTDDKGAVGSAEVEVEVKQFVEITLEAVYNIIKDGMVAFKKDPQNLAYPFIELTGTPQSAQTWLSQISPYIPPDGLNLLQQNPTLLEQVYAANYYFRIEGEDVEGPLTILKASGVTTGDGEFLPYQEIHSIPIKVSAETLPILQITNGSKGVEIMRLKIDAPKATQYHGILLKNIRFRIENKNKIGELAQWPDSLPAPTIKLYDEQGNLIGQRTKPNDYDSPEGWQGTWLMFPNQDQDGRAEEGFCDWKGGYTIFGGIEHRTTKTLIVKLDLPLFDDMTYRSYFNGKMIWTVRIRNQEPWEVGTNYGSPSEIYGPTVAFIQKPPIVTNAGQWNFLLNNAKVNECVTDGGVFSGKDDMGTVHFPVEGFDQPMEREFNIVQ